MTGPVVDPTGASKVALVTGAASGIGAAVARRFLNLGYRVIGVDQAVRPPEFGTDALSWVQGDVGSPATWTEVDRVVEETVMPSPGVAVMNAATFRTGDVLELNVEDWKSILDTNVVGAALGMKAVLPGMIRRGGGAIVTVASVDGLLAEQGAASYCASKAALIQLSRATAVDFAHKGVRVNCVCPGTTDTPLFRWHLARSHDPPAERAERAARNPLGRILEPDEVASAVEFLAGPSSSGITGAVLMVDAGLTASYDFRQLAVAVPQ